MRIHVEYLSRKALLEELSGYVRQSADSGLYMCVDELQASRSKEILAELDRRVKVLPFTEYEKSLADLEELQNGMTRFAKQHFYELASESVEWLL